SGAELFNGPAVLGRRVAFVRGQTVGGKNLVPNAHAGVAVNLRNNGRGGDGVAAGIAFDEGALRQGKIEGDGVGEQEVRSGREPAHREAHGQARGLVDVDGIYGGGVHGGDGPAHGALA